MKTLLTALILACGSGLIGAPPAAAESAADPDVRITVKAVSAGTDRKGKTTTSSRRLEIHLENREHTELSGLTLDWYIYGKDVQSHNSKIEAKGSKPVKLDAKGTLDLESDTARFTETKGGVKTEGKGKNRRQVGVPDKGRDYAGYVVKLKQGGRVIATAGTNSLKNE